MRVVNAAGKWLVRPCCRLRMIVRRSATRARWGRCSQAQRPGTAVAIGRNSPRTSAGALGFMSHNAGHFAPETNGDVIATLMREFLGKHVAVAYLAGPEVPPGRTY